MNESLQEALDQNFFNLLASRDCLNPKTLICFSGVPYSGRTTIAKAITERFSGVYVDKDQARTLIYQNEKIGNTQQPEDLLDEYMPTVFDRLKKDKNGLITLNASIDRKYDEYAKWAKGNDYKLIIIDIDIPLETAENAIKKERDEKTAEWFVGQFSRWYADHETFLANHEIDYTIYDAERDLPGLLDYLMNIKLGENG